MLRAVGMMVLMLAILIGLFARSAIGSMNYDKMLTFSLPSCRLLAAPTACEDLTAFEDGLAFAGCGDMGGVFEVGSADAAEGNFYLLDANRHSLRKVKVMGPMPAKLLLHGIHYSGRSRRLYAVNHDETHGESVEVFEAHGRGAAVQLRHELTIRSPLFGNIALNDVVEGEGDELYVTEWLPFGAPLGGAAGLKNATFVEQLRKGLVAPIQLAGIRSTRIFRCTVTAAPDCHVATDARFIMANGIAISEDRRLLFIADTVGQTISILERQAEGALTKLSSFPTVHKVDNIEMGPDGSLYGGTVPLPYTSRVVCIEAADLALTKVVDGREVGCGKAPGGALRISIVSSDGGMTAGTQADLAMHDGSLLSGVSSALLLGAKVAMGSPDSPGVLLCDM